VRPNQALRGPKLEGRRGKKKPSLGELPIARVGNGGKGLKKNSTEKKGITTNCQETSILQAKVVFPILAHKVKPEG